MSLKANIAANYLGQAAQVLVNLLVVPVYISLLGAEAYGLVGFMVTLQAWLNVLDLGLTTTLSRECSMRQTPGGAGLIATQLRATESLMLMLGLLVAGALCMLSGWLTDTWLHEGSIPSQDIITSIQLMGVCIGLRYLSALHRGVMAGMEKMVPLNVASVAITVARAGGTVLAMEILGGTPVVFFGASAGFALLELLLYSALVYGPKGLPLRPWRPQPSSLSPIMPLSGHLALLSLLWLVTSQADRVILSHLLSLHDYGGFSVAMVLTGTIPLLCTPLIQALQPRLGALTADGNEMAFREAFSRGSQLSMSLASTVSLALAFFGADIARLWTGNAMLAEAISPYIALYALGNGIAVVLALAFQAQFAKGVVRWHLLGCLISAVLCIPAGILASSRFGAVGAGWTWLLGNLAFMLLWLPVSLGKVLPGIRRSWLLRDVGGTAMACSLPFLCQSGLEKPHSRLWLAIWIIGTMVFALGLGLLTSLRLREQIRDAFRLTKHHT